MNHNLFGHEIVFLIHVFFLCNVCIKHFSLYGVIFIDIIDLSSLLRRTLVQSVSVNT